MPGWFKGRSRQPEPKVIEHMVNGFMEAKSWPFVNFLLHFGEEESGQSPLLADATITWIKEKIADWSEMKDSGAAEFLELLLHLLEDARATSIDDAWARFKQKIGNEPAPGTAKETLEQWSGLDTWEEAQQILIHQQSILFSWMSLCWMRFNVARVRLMDAEPGTKELPHSLEIELHWLEDARAHGINAAWNNMTALIARHRAAKAALERLFVAQNWGEAQQVLLQHKSALLSEEAGEILDHNIFRLKGREQMKRAGQLEWQLRLLERSRAWCF